MQYDYIIELLNLQETNLIVDDVSCEKNMIKISVHKDINFSDKACKHCGSADISINSYHVRKLKFLDIANNHSVIHYRQRRFICNDCNKTFNEQSTIAEKGTTISYPLKLKIFEDAKSKRSFKDISEENCVSDVTVHNTFHELASDFRCKLSEVICIDEFRASTIAGTYALIIGDPVSGKILDVLPSRRQDYIYEYFNKISDEERYSVKYVVTDLFESYKVICETLFWKSTHIADRFHWIRQATEAFNNIRIRIMKNYEKLGREVHKGTYNKYTQYAAILKKYHKLLLCNKYSKEGWFFEEKTVASYLKKEMTLQEIIEYCINQDSDLEEAYLLLQDLYKLAKYSNYETARKNILDWCERVSKSEANIKEYNRVVLTYKHWLTPIVNSFIINPKTKSRLTNGFIEGKNNFVKVIKRIGFGFKNFETFRYRILYADNKTRPFKATKKNK